MSTKRWKLDSSRARVFHFPPLAQNGQEQLVENPQQQQQALEQGYQEGLELGRSAGYADGHEEGLQAGEAKGVQLGQQQGMQSAKMHFEQQLNQLLPPITALQQQLQEGHEQQLKQHQQLILELVQKVAEQVTRCELTLHPQQVLSLIDETLDSLPESKVTPKIFLDSTTLNKLKEQAPEHIKSWDMQEDPSLSIGDVRVVTDECEADASAQSRLDNCMKHVAKHLVDDDGLQA